jgi:hypothetical protein
VREPAEYAAEIERDAMVPAGSGERFFGYGVMGLPFESGHVLALRRFPASSIGPGYRSVWHRSPSGRWTFYQDVPAELACTRYFGAAVAEVREGPIDIAWTGPRSLAISADDGALTWTVQLASTPVTSALNRVAALLPDRAWHSPPVLAVMSRIAGRALSAGQVRLTGLAPNGQRFVVNPLQMWIARDSAARLDGRDLGAMGPASDQAQLRDFAIPQRGVFVVGRAFFAPDVEGLLGR